MQNKKVEYKIFAKKTQLQDREYLYVRLNEIFNHIVPRQMIYKSFKNESAFQADSPYSLCVLFDNKIDPEPDFSGPTKAKIFFQNNQLIVQISPLDGRKKKREEIIFSSLEKVSFKYFGIHNKKIGWQSTWNQQMFPKMIHLSLVLKKDPHPVEFVFFLPTINPLITYT